MSTQTNNINKEKRILKISITSSAIFVILELVFAVLGNSQAVLMDALYDSSEIIMMIISLNLIPILYKPMTEKRPYGYAQLESLFILIKSLMILIATISLLVNSINIIENGGNNTNFLMVGIFQGIVFIFSLIPMLIIKKNNKTINSPLIKAEIAGYMIDVFYSGFMCIGFFIPVFIKTDFIISLSPYIDQIITIFLVIFTIPIPIKIFITSFKDMFLFAPEPATMEIIHNKTKNILTENSIPNYSLDVIRTGRKLWVCIYFNPINDLISISNLSLIQNQIQEDLQKELGDVYLELLPDIE